MVKQGYKQTEIGVIPEDWEVKIWSDVATGFSAGATPYRAIADYYKGNVKWVTSGELNYNTIYDTLEHISEEAKRKTNLKTHPKGTFLMAITGLEAAGTRGSCAILGCEATTNQSCMAIYESPELNIKYLYHYYVRNGNELAFKFCQGTKQQSYTASIVKTLPIILPKLHEQQKIAEVLSDTDDLISSLEKLIAKKKAVKQGAMQELLTGKKRLPGFDKAWEVFLLGDIGTITGSGVDKKILPDEEPITLLNYTNVYHQISIARQDLNHQVTASSEKIKNCYVLKGDVFLTPTSETPEDIALSAVATEDMPDVVYSYHVVRLRPNLNFNGAFVNYALSVPMFREQALQFAEGSGIRYVITLKKFKEMQVFIPTEKAEQDAIISILSDMDNEIEALEQKLAKTRQLKQGMMQQLLTGKIRLVGKETITDITAEQENPPETKTGHNHQFDDAVMIAAIVNSFYSEKYPLGRKKVQKLLYLLRRKQEADTSEFKKKAAGPYADEIRYKGGEPIAKKNGYISATTTPKGTSFSKGKKMDAALSYVKKWKMQSDIDWLVSNFKYIGVNDLELYATIDMAICDLRNEGVGISVDSVKELICSNPEWKAKLKKAYFSDTDIARAINISKQLYS